MLLASSILKVFKVQLCPEEPSAEWLFKSRWWRYQKPIQNLLGAFATACESASGQAFAKTADMVTAKAMDYGESYLAMGSRLCSHRKVINCPAGSIGVPLWQDLADQAELCMTAGMFTDMGKDDTELSFATAVIDSISSFRYA